ncbi:ubiquitin carboxyl-terminal hydrolase 4 [Amyelois transitella]|uniref:ubiquitin carboxyl-terminal hydrolase 4 n=1 Tax=Amyelois transitella TaxID=680683 RepID=UPI002990380F|nr:ubiquitin carboxyl-terminal hydrolase 4 [Amyelois transitella]
MSTNNLSSVLKSCSESELINEISDTSMTPKQVEGSRLKRTFTLPRNPFGTIKPSVSKNKTNESDKLFNSNSDAIDSQKEAVTIERKLFRRPSWRRFLNKIAQHMSTVNVSSVKSAPPVMNGERVPCSGDPPWPPGTTPAATGIKNHGNTCYMNAVLQCLSHTDVIAEYFVLDHYKLDLQKRNKINSKKYGTRGEITEQLAALLKALWACHYTSDMSTTFKGVVERHGTQYRGNNQHDAQEFLFWLLDKVHEDLNTATKKKYKTIKNTCGKPDEVVAAETLANHARRNSSFVQAVFQAQYRSALTCAKCERTSCTFDPFHCVSVQLPSRLATAQPSPLPVNVVYVNQQPRQVRIGVELSQNATMDDLRTTLHNDTGIERDHIILAEINEMGWCVARAGWEAAGLDCGALYCVEAPPLLQAPTTPYLLLLWVNLLDGERFGSPYAMQVPREISYEDLQKLMLKEMCQVVAERVLENSQGSDIFRARIAEAHRPKDSAYLQPELPHPLFALAVEQALCAHDTHPHLRLELLWDAAHRDSIIRSSEEACEVHVSCGTVAPLTLHACLQHYTRAEHLAQEDAWRCPQCQRYMPVVKTLGLWSLPDILVIHLKRFRQQAKGRTSTKLTTMVEFPLNDFDMTPHLVRRNTTNADSPGHSRSPRRRHSKTSTSPQENMYDLYAICYHHGDDLETGHYTAACKNPYDGHWYKFDDSRVTQVDDDNAYSELVNNTAYMLFYKRKKPIVTHSCSVDDQSVHWALRMPKFTKQTTESLNDITEIKEENVEDGRNEILNNEPESETDITAPTHSPLSRSVESLPDDSMTEAPSPVKQTVTTVVHNTASIIRSPTLQRPLLVEVNGNKTNEDANKNETTVTIEPYIHKDVHVNPKMTPVDTRRPRSVDYPSRSTTSANSDSNRNYESSPLVASINGVEYHPTTEDLMLSMFQESKYIVPRHGNHIAGESHPSSEKSAAWQTRIST